MLQPKKRAERTGYWESLSDNDLMNVELTTDSPNMLDGLVTVLPEGSSEAYVEFKYDLRKTDSEEVRCIHCHQPHLAGYVMKKGMDRFLVGHICGEHIYGERFERFTNDYDAAVERRETVRRVKDARLVIEPFMDWLQQLSKSQTFYLYESVRSQFDSRVEWLAKELRWRTNSGGGQIEGYDLPATFFDGFTSSPRRDFLEVVPTIMSDCLLLIGKIEIQKDTRTLLGRLQVALSKVEKVIRQLAEPVDFFQPDSLARICAWATENDDPRKRKYEPGLMSIIYRKDWVPIIIHLPASYHVPSLEPLQKLRAALAGFNVG
jgi:hypothetical protein